MPENETKNVELQPGLNEVEALAEKFIGKVSWKIMLLRSLASLLAGIMVFAWPSATLIAIALVVGVYFIFNGLMAFGAVWSIRKGKFLMSLYGIVCVAAGAIAFKNPLFTDFLIVMFIAAWAIVNGIGELGLAIKMTGGGPMKFMLGFSGLISLVFGVSILFLNVKSDLTILIWITGFYFLMTGFSLLFMTIAMKSIQKQLRQ